MKNYSSIETISQQFKDRLLIENISMMWKKLTACSSTVFQRLRFLRDIEMMFFLDQESVITTISQTKC